MFKPKVKTKPEHDKIPQLALVTLTRRNKKHLFQDSIDASKNSIEKSEALIARLEQFDPSTAQEFGFKDVAVSQAPFRLLCSVPTRTKAIRGLKNIFSGFEVENSKPYWMSISSSDTQFNSFIALSYCWHNRDWTPAPGCRPLEGWPISSMMLRALLDQRQSPDEGIWIDACCIEQSNETEKMHAVGSVDIVYKSARLVVIILEDVYLPYEDVDTIRGFTADGQDRDCHKAEPPTISRGFTRVLSSRWFSRAWCSHEFLLCANSLFLVPTERGLIQLTMKNLAELFMTLCHDSAASGAWDSVPIRAFGTLTECYLFRNVEDIRRSPMAQFAGIIDLHASFETDKIGIASNVAGLQLYFSGPKKSEHQCRWILVMLALSAGDLTSLCGKDTAIQPSAEANRLPWLRWNKASEDRVASLSPPSFSKLSKIAFIEPDHIILDLHILKHCSFHRPSTDSILNATKFVDRYSKAIRRQEWKERFITPPQLLRERILQIKMLACSLDCGLAWLTENIIFNQDMANDMRGSINNRKLDLWPMIADLLIDAYPLEKPALSNFPNERKQSASLYIHFVMCDLGTKGLSFFGSDKLDLYEDHWGWLDSGTLCGKALVPSLCGKFAQCHFAVPAALAGSTCATMDRLWLLRPRGGAADSEWTIVEKTQFMTFRPLEADGENIIHRAKQTIRG